MKEEVFYSYTDDLENIPDTFFSSYNDALEAAVKNKAKYILRTIQTYEVMIELENITNEYRDTGN